MNDIYRMEINFANGRKISDIPAILKEYGTDMAHAHVELNADGQIVAIQIFRNV